MLISFVRTVILYTVLTAGMRILGKRQIGQLEPSEFVVSMLIADLAAVPMQNTGIPLLHGLVPMVTVLGLGLVLSGLTVLSVPLRNMLCGKPIILIQNGKLDQGNLRLTRITLDELTGHLRQKDVLDLTTVQYAILETNGSLSVFPYPKDQPATAKDAGIQAKKQYLPLTVVEDGYLCTGTLKRAGKDENWVRRVLEERKTTLADTFLLTVDGSDKIHWVGKEKKS